MEWLIVLVLVLGILAMLFPVALVWYLNVSGLYQVIRDARRRQKMRAAVLREAEEIIQGKVTVGAAEKGKEQLAETVGPRGAA